MSILNITHEYNTITYTIVDIDNNFYVTFWTDGSLVVYAYDLMYILNKWKYRILNVIR